jgi:hypothetical protein
MSNRFSDYDVFARAYSRHWGPKAGDTQLPVLHDLLLPRLPAKAAIHDLCCGSGTCALIALAVVLPLALADEIYTQRAIAREEARLRR